jgi:hypothetical protein
MPAHTSTSKWHMSESALWDLSGDACDFDKVNLKWIGKGHKYPNNPPAALLAYQEDLMY